MSTGENEQGLRSIIDFLRKASILILTIHIYYYCYTAFDEWGLTKPFVKKILVNVSATGIFKHPVYTKMFALALLIISMIGTKGRKDEKVFV